MSPRSLEAAAECGGQLDRLPGSPSAAASVDSTITGMRRHDQWDGQRTAAGRARENKCTPRRDPWARQGRSSARDRARARAARRVRRARVHRQREDRGRDRPRHRVERVAPGGVAGVGRVADLQIVVPARRGPERSNGSAE